MKRRDFAKTLAAAGATLAASPMVACAEGGHGSLLSSKPAFAHKSVEDIPVVLECAINGGATKAMNPVAPETAKEQTEEIIRCFDAGVTVVHSHSNQPNEDPKKAAQFYLEAYKPVLKKHPHAIMYGTANFDPKVYNRTHKVWPGEVQCGHHRILAEAGVTKMVLFDTAVTPFGVYGKDGVAGPESAFFWYGFWPDDVRYMQKLCKEFGTGGSISVFEPCWMKNVVAMARTGTLPRGSKLNLYFGSYSLSSMAPPIPEALAMYLKMIEGLDLKWTVAYIGEKSVLDTPLARLALELGGSIRVGLEDYSHGPSNLEQIARVKQLINAVGRPIVSGAEAIEYLDIPFAATRPKS